MPRNTVMGPGDFIEDEYQVGATDVEPGHLVEVVAGEVVPHSTAAGDAITAFAIEAQHLGRTPDDTYLAADDDNVHVAYTATGTKVNLAWLADTFTVAEGDLLVSNGDGTLRPLDTVGGDAEGIVVAAADEALANASGGPLRLEVKSA